jgi:hypothetical protein
MIVANESSFPYRVSHVAWLELRLGYGSFSLLVGIGLEQLLHLLLALGSLWLIEGLPACHGH